MSKMLKMTFFNKHYNLDMKEDFSIFTINYYIILKQSGSFSFRSN